MTQSGSYTLITLAPLLVILIGLGITVTIDPYINRGQRGVLLLIVVLTFRVVLKDGIGYLLATKIVNIPWRTWNSVVGYTVRPVILLLFLYVIGMKRRTWPFWLLIGVNALVHLTALVSDRICFGFPENVFHRGPLGFTSHAVSGILLVYLLFRTYREYSRVKQSEMWIPICNALLVVAAVVLDSTVLSNLGGPISLTTIAMVCATLFYYIWLHLQFVLEHEQDLMAAQRIQIMMTQIQPHFLFNALNTIRALYARDPPLADRTLEDFSAYLRQNLESLSQTELVPITKELEHTRLYAEIEALRFPNVRVEYRIEDESFRIPALTVQPLVENAIRHGVRCRKDGLVTVSTALESGAHRITVQDNGVGFDPKRQTDQEGAHIGLRNVKERVEQMCSGVMLLQSGPGTGTTVTLLIPDAAGKAKKEKRK